MHVTISGGCWKLDAKAAKISQLPDTPGGRSGSGNKVDDETLWPLYPLVVPKCSRNFAEGSLHPTDSYIKIHRETDNTDVPSYFQRRSPSLFPREYRVTSASAFPRDLGQNRKP